ncbi:unnamed protein product [Candida verbasci]|uniref:Bromodomain associated domain-containing protein n=1 Tax=Candida verbasci TaxID=1227364 RepID=A0A9W4TP62_9ASCO|nr:unnamed protein product [Candida verbasci]
MDDSFYFSLLRISIAQILKANGFDKCKPSIVNILTDIYLNFFNSLAAEAVKCSNLRNQSNDMEIQDVTQTLINIGFLKVNNITSIYDMNFNESKYNTKGVESFKNWVTKSDTFKTEKMLNQVPESLIKSLIEKRKLTPMESSEEILMKKRQKHKERQEYYNSLKLNNVDTQKFLQQEEEDEDEITFQDKLNWFNYLIEKDLKLGHDLKYLNTDESIVNEFMKFQNNDKLHPIDENKKNNENHRKGLSRINYHLQNLNKNDYIIVDIKDEIKLKGDEKEKDKDKDKHHEEEENERIIKPPDELMDALPYNVKYNDLLTDDLIEEVEEMLEEGDSYMLEDNEHNNDKLDDHHNNIIQEDDHHNNIIQEDDGLLKQEEDDNDMQDGDNHEDVNDDGIGGDNNLIFM